MSLLDGGDLDALVASLRFRLTRQSALAANVVNADTPGYRRTDLSFDGLLQDAAVRLERTDPGHLARTAGRLRNQLSGPKQRCAQVQRRGAKPPNFHDSVRHPSIPLPRQDLSSR